MPSPLIYSLANCEVSSVMNFWNAKNVALIEIHRQMCLVYGVDVMSKPMIRRWCRAFSGGSKMSMTNNAAAGYHSSMTTSLSRCSSAFCRTVTFRLRNSLAISRKYHDIWCMKHHETPSFRKLCARWMPKNLTSEHTIKRMEAALTFLQRYHDEGNEFLNRIITRDNMWVAQFTPEAKQQSM